MKKIISFCLIIATVCLLAFSLTGCKKDDGVPEGMQLVRGGSEYGYNFYAPEEWTVSNHGDIACAYVSKLDQTSVTFVKAEAPVGDAEASVKDKTVAYFDADMAKFPFTIKVEDENKGAKTTFGNATEAYKFIYSYDYNGATIGVMQIFVYNGNDFYIFTYTSSYKEKEEGTSYYDYYLDKVSSIITNFRFIEKSGEPAKPEYTPDENGNILVSDKAICGFTMYVPAAYKVDYSSGIVSVTRDDGTNINMSETDYAATDTKDYWAHKKQTLEAIVGTVTEGEMYVDVSSQTKAGWGCAYNYSYTFGGTEYQVYQVLINEGWKLYVFTYTATKDNFDAHIDEAKSVLANIEF
ncbi:MAG: hypothetical protein IKV43_00500 [Clostridia bacterium]|nr:hypothetical protein [Clostridia bacterium]